MRQRVLVLFLSFGTIIAFGYALGGLGSYMFGEGKPLVIAAGLIGGALSGFMALKIWRTYLDDIEREDKDAGKAAGVSESPQPDDDCEK